MTTKGAQLSFEVDVEGGLNKQCTTMRVQQESSIEKHSTIGVTPYIYDHQHICSNFDKENDRKNTKILGTDGKEFSYPRFQHYR